MSHERSVPLFVLLAAAACVWASGLFAADSRHLSRMQYELSGHASRFRDRVLVSCLSQAYRSNPSTTKDMDNSLAALGKRESYPGMREPSDIKPLVDSYLARDYHLPLAEAEIKGIRFDLLKCLDLYHDQERRGDGAKRLGRPPA